MNIYDQAHELARALRETPEYTQRAELKARAEADATNKALLDEYQRLQSQLRLNMASGKSMDPDDVERMQKIGTVLQLNDDASAYLMADLRLQMMLGDIYKILGDAVGLGLV